MNLLLVDDHPMVFNALEIILERQPEPFSLEFLPNFGEALARVGRAPQIELVLLDLSLPGFEGTRTLATFREQFPTVRVAVISGEQDPEIIASCMALGACGFVPKSTGSTALLNAIRMIADGGMYMPGEGGYLDPIGRIAEQFSLTRRQQDVLAHLVQAKSNREIANDLEVSVNTVAVHVSAIFSALNVSNRTELIGVAARLGLLPGTKIN